MATTDEAGFQVVPIGVVESPISDLVAAPRQPDEGAPGATVVLRPDLLAAIDGLAVGDEVVVVTWLHLADRTARTTVPRGDPGRAEQGVFSTRSPDRPNPIGLHRTTIVGIDGTRVAVDRLEVLDATPVLDLKPALGDADER